MDSTAALWWALANRWQTEALTIDYRQRSRGELEAATRVAQTAGVAHRVIRLAGDYVPATIGDGTASSGAFIRARNLMLVSIAASTFGSETGAIVVGITGADPYPDCQPEFLEAVEPMLTAVGDAPGVHIVAPLLACQDKAGVIALGDRFGVPWAMTWSCDVAARRPCGQCASCVSRARAFGEHSRGKLIPSPGIIQEAFVGIDDEIKAKQAAADSAARRAKAWDRSPGGRSGERDLQLSSATGAWVELIDEILQSRSIHKLIQTGYLYTAPDGTTRFTGWVGSWYKRLKCQRVRYVIVMDPSGKDHESQFGLKFLTDGRLLTAYGSPDKVRKKAIELLAQR